MRLLLALALLPAQPAAALTPAIPGQETGAWECLDGAGRPAFAVSILDSGLYADPSGAPGGYVQPGWGRIDFTGGLWAGSGGSFVPGIMALNLPEGGAPVICLHRPAG